MSEPSRGGKKEPVGRIEEFKSYCPEQKMKDEGAEEGELRRYPHFDTGVGGCGKLGNSAFAIGGRIIVSLWPDNTM